MFNTSITHNDELFFTQCKFFFFFILIQLLEITRLMRSLMYTRTGLQLLPDGYYYCNFTQQRVEIFDSKNGSDRIHV
jgi:hypothetical protein